MSRTALLQAALALPSVAGLAWLGLVEWPPVRRSVAGALALGAHAAAWGVLVSTYRGGELGWRSFEPDLLGATVVVITEIALLLAVVRAERLPGGGNAPAVVGLAVSASAIAALAYAGSLAGADVVALIGLSLVYARTGSVALGEAGGPGPPLLLLSALIKSGAIPGLATWRLAATEGPGSWLDGALRGQAIALAALATLTMRSGASADALANMAAAAILAGGLVAVLSRTRAASVAAVTGAAAGVPFLALGLGGVVGTRAFLLVFPAFLLASGVVALLARPAAEEPAEPLGAGSWRWLAAGALGVGLGSLLGMPPGGGFPGTWLAVSLAATRGESTLGWLVTAGAAGVGLALAMKASIGLIRAVRSGAVPAAIAAVGALSLLYLGTQPIRVAIGWWVRIETALGLPEVLPTAGAPGFPVFGGMRLTLALAPAVLLVAIVIALGRGVRETGWGFAPLRPAAGKPSALRERVDVLIVPIAAGSKPVADLLDRARSIGAGFGIAAVLEVVGLMLVGRIVVLAAGAGFL